MKAAGFILGTGMYVLPRRSAWPFVLSASAALWPRAPALGGATLLTRAADVRALTQEEAAEGLPVRLRGVLLGEAEPPKPDRGHVWRADGARVLASRVTEVGAEIVALFPDGSGVAESVARFPQDASAVPSSWSGAARGLLVHGRGRQTEMDVTMFPAAGGDPSPLLVSPADESSAVFSPDGRFIAYASNESARTEIYVRPYPAPAPRTQVSNEGGSQPIIRSVRCCWPATTSLRTDAS